MDTTTLQNLISNSNVFLDVDGIEITAEKSWVVDNEYYLSYTTLIRLIECCREHHWNKDIKPKLREKDIDTTCRSINIKFSKSIRLSKRFKIKYKISKVTKYTYDAVFTIIDKNYIIYSVAFLKMIFICTNKRTLVQMPADIKEHLNQLKYRVEK